MSSGWYFRYSSFYLHNLPALIDSGAKKTFKDVDKQTQPSWYFRNDTLFFGQSDFRFGFSASKYVEKTTSKNFQLVVVLAKFLGRNFQQMVPYMLSHVIQNPHAAAAPFSPRRYALKKRNARWLMNLRITSTTSTKQESRVATAAFFASSEEPDDICTWSVLDPSTRPRNTNFFCIIDHLSQWLRAVQVP